MKRFEAIFTNIVDRKFNGFRILDTQGYNDLIFDMTCTNIFLLKTLYGVITPTYRGITLHDCGHMCFLKFGDKARCCICGNKTPCLVCSERK